MLVENDFFKFYGNAIEDILVKKRDNFFGYSNVFVNDGSE